MKILTMRDPHALSGMRHLLSRNTRLAATSMSEVLS